MLRICVHQEDSGQWVFHLLTSPPDNGEEDTVVYTPLPDSVAQLFMAWGTQEEPHIEHDVEAGNVRNPGIDIHLIMPHHESIHRG